MHKLYNTSQQKIESLLKQQNQISVVVQLVVRFVRQDCVSKPIMFCVKVRTV